MPKDTNANAYIFGDWLVSQMDLTAASRAKWLRRGPSMTVAIKNAHFISPVKVGAAVSCYAEVIKTGKASVQIM
jgi:acyl-CoA thioesterase YciA